jgi:DNA-binding transcriptional LysR family regulator
MDLKYEDLKTFLEVHKAGTFTKASESLGLSQSALSQKIARLEDNLQAAIFIRNPRSLSLTSSGEKLLIYAKECVDSQDSFLNSFNQYQEEISGVIRIATYSSIMRSLIIPKLTPFLRKNPKVSIEFKTHEIFELKSILKSNQADFIISDYFLDAPGVLETKIAQEQYVIISAKKYKNIPNTFIDHGAEDNATDSYFKFIGKKLKYNRIFMGEVYSIVDGVAAGLGKAVMSKHIIENDKRFIIEETKKKYLRPIVLGHIKQSYYSPLHQYIKDILL